jgi:hypothetical protein
MISDESLTVSDACNGALEQSVTGEATGLRHLTAQAHNTTPLTSEPLEEWHRYFPRSPNG